MLELKDLFSAYQRTRALVFGASGFIGRWVSKYLTLAGADLWLVARDKERMNLIAKSYGIEGIFLQADLAIPGTCKKVIGQAAPQIIFNAVGYGIAPLDQDDTLAWNINDRFVGELAGILRTSDLPDWNGSRLVHVGSGKEYGPIHGAVKENLQIAPLTLYGQSKLAGTRRLNTFCQKTGFPAIIARLFSVYGPGEHPTRLLSSILMASSNQHPLTLNSGAQRRDFTYVEDVAEGLLRLGLLEDSRGEILHLATGELHTVKEFAFCVTGLLNYPKGMLNFRKRPDRSEEWRHGPVSVEGLSQLLHWKPSTPIEVGINKTVEFMKNIQRGNA